MVAIADVILGYTVSRNGPLRIVCSLRYFSVSAHIARNMMLVRQLLVSHLVDTIGIHPIGLLIPRSLYIKALIDAS